MWDLRRKPFIEILFLEQFLPIDWQNSILAIKTTYLPLHDFFIWPILSHGVVHRSANYIITSFRFANAIFKSTFTVWHFKLSD